MPAMVPRYLWHLIVLLPNALTCCATCVLPWKSPDLLSLGCSFSFSFHHCLPTLMLGSIDSEHCHIIVGNGINHPVCCPLHITPSLVQSFKEGSHEKTCACIRTNRTCDANGRHNNETNLKINHPKFLNH